MSRRQGGIVVWCHNGRGMEAPVAAALGKLDGMNLFDPYWMASTSGTTHGTPFSYDTHIPLVLMGPGIRPGRYDRNVLLNDLAPTLATLLDVETPSGSSGQVLTEILDHSAAPARTRGAIR